MAKKNLCGDPVSDWMAFILFPALGIEFSEGEFSCRVLSDDKAIFFGNGIYSGNMITLERRAISKYFGYMLVLNDLGHTRRLFTLEKEFIEGSEGYRAESCDHISANAREMFSKNFKGLHQWPR
jgi:hypothetical protein